MSESPQESPINICPNCGADLFEVGVVEAISGGYSETEIHFVDGKTKIGTTNIKDFDEQWALCRKCCKRIEYTAADIIEAFENLYPPKVEKNHRALLTIDVKAPILPENMEKLEDGLRDFLNSKGIEAVIENPSTGNTTVANGVAI